MCRQIAAQSFASRAVPAQAVVSALLPPVPPPAAGGGLPLTELRGAAALLMETGKSRGPP